MLKPAEDLAVGDVIAVSGRPYRIACVRRSFDAVWADVVPAAAPAALELPTRHDYGTPVAVTRLTGAAR